VISCLTALMDVQIDPCCGDGQETAKRESAPACLRTCHGLYCARPDSWRTGLPVERWV
jgi:hypothetical protein